MKSFFLKLVDRLNLFPLFNRYTANTATVFMLHRILPDGEGGSKSLTTGRLTQFLDYLKKHKYNVITLAEYITALKEHRNTYKTVVFTVDDGFRDFYLNAYPIFRDFDYTATVFLTSDFIERKLFLWWNQVEFAIDTTMHMEVDLEFIGYNTFMVDDEQKRSKVTKLIIEHLKKLPNDTKLTIIERLIDRLEVDISDQPVGIYTPLTWDEIIEMSKHRIDFHPHTKTHPIMTRIPYKKKLAELSESKRILENKLNRGLDIFCYPNGGLDDFDEETIKALRETGYTAAVMGIAGFENTKADTDLFRIHRFAIPAEPASFKQYVCGLEYFKTRYFS